MRCDGTRQLLSVGCHKVIRSEGSGIKWEGPKKSESKTEAVGFIFSWEAVKTSRPSFAKPSLMFVCRGSEIQRN